MEAAAASARLSINRWLPVHFVLLHHGYHGRASDFRYLCSIAEDALRQQQRDQNSDAQRHYGRAAAFSPSSPSSSAVPPSSSPPYVFILPQGSDLYRTEGGVWTLAKRYTEQVCATFSATFAPTLPADATESPTGFGKILDDVDANTGLELHFTAIGHSLGGLILRAAMPALMDRVRHLAQKLPHSTRVCWDTFCTLAAPHLGVRYMRSPIMRFLGGSVGWRVSPTLADLFLKSNVIAEDLATEESLAAWGKFKRRVLLNVVNDGTVMVYSSSFVIPVSVRTLIGTPLPPPHNAAREDEEAAEKPVVHVDHNKGTAEENTSVAEAARGPSLGKAQNPPEKQTWTADVPNADASVVHLAEHGVHCASTVDGLRRNGLELRELSTELWPPELLPQDRALAERILRRVGPLELHLVDFRPLRDALVQELPPQIAQARKDTGRMAGCMAYIGAHRFSHAAMMCKPPFHYPPYFGCVSEYLVSDVLGISLDKVAEPRTAPLGSFVPSVTDADAKVAFARVVKDGEGSTRKTEREPEVR